MKPQELRIGNWVGTPDGIFQVAVIFDTGIKVDIGYGAVQQYSDSSIRPDFSNVKPIPITEEWLKKFGFEYIEDTEYYWKQNPLENWGYRLVEFPRGTWVISQGFMNKFNELAHINYVHQLQNLYFALTGEELEIQE